MSNVLIISPDRISESMAGPGVRYWNLAIQLAKEHKVTLLVKNSDYLKSQLFNVVLIADIRNSLKQFVMKYDVIIIQGLTLLEMPFLKKTNIPIVIDLYDPFIFEILAHENWENSSTRLYESQLQILLEQIRYGDYFICASEKQRDLWIGFLAASMRINPLTFKNDPTLRSLIGIVPFGLPDEDPVKERKVMKGVIEGIKEEDKLVIWWGGLWDWLDPKTLVKAMDLIREENSNVKCVIVGVKHPDPAFITHKIVKEVQDLSMELNLTGSNVFFLDWVKYEDRMNYLLESDIGISLHYNNLETRFSFRTRILDYLWSSLPMVVSRGDILAELISKYGLGEVIKEGDHIELANKIVQVLESGDYKKNFQEARKNYYWSEVIKDLNNFCHNPIRAVDRNYLSKHQRNSSPNKSLIYLHKGISLILEGRIRTLFLKIREKTFKRY